MNRGMFRLSVSSRAVSVPTAKSAVPSTVIIAPSHAASPDSSSPKKSTYPGTSKKLNLKD